MKNSIRSAFLSLLSLALFSSAALAEERYFGVDYEFIKYTETFTSEDSIALNGVGVTLGYMFSTKWGVESKLGMGLGPVQAKFDSELTELELGNYISLLAVRRYSFSREFHLYLKGGLTRTEVTTKTKIGNVWIADNRDSSGQGGLSFMLGADYRFNDNSALTVELGNLSNRLVKNLYGVNFGLKKVF